MMFKSRNVTWTGHLAYLKKRRNAHEIFVRKLQGWRPKGIVRRIKTKCIFKKHDMKIKSRWELLKFVR